MSEPGKPVSYANEIPLDSLLGTLEAHKEKALVFHYDERDVRQSYHVTEVKTGVQCARLRRKS